MLGALLLLAQVPALAATSAAQSCCTVSGGSDLTSALVWRGLQFSTAPGLEPWVEVGWRSTYIGAVSSVAIDGSWTEHEFEAGVGVPTGTGTVTVASRLYVFPRYAPEATSPVGELAVEYTAGGAFPVRLLVSRNLLHDPDGAMQAEVGISHAWRGLASEAFASVALNRSRFYEAGAGAVLQYGLGLEWHVASVGPADVSLAGVAAYSPAHARGWLMAHLGFTLPAPRVLEAPCATAQRHTCIP